MGQIDWETTGAIGLGILIAASAASLGVWKTTVERKASPEAAAATAQATPKRRPQPRPGDDLRRMRPRDQAAPAAADIQNLPPGHPPLNLPAPAAGPKTTQPGQPAPGVGPARPAPLAPMPVRPVPVAPKPVTPQPAPQAPTTP